ncbi:hypothetical protein Bbelb_048460 [Branchiostoma belcheri]|nr:hypothetical protein Bbelb_048460 [Branchiostoma belcheri]
MKVDPVKLDHFIPYITSAHVVQDLPFEEKVLKLSFGESVKVPNTIRAMIPERIISQYQQYCAESHFVSMGKRALLASVRTSLQGLDYFTAEVFEGGNNTKQAKEKTNRKVGNYIIKRCSKALHTARTQTRTPEILGGGNLALNKADRDARQAMVESRLPQGEARDHAAVLADSIGSGTAIRRANDLLGASHPRTVHLCHVSHQCPPFSIHPPPAPLLPESPTITPPRTFALATPGMPAFPHLQPPTVPPLGPTTLLPPVSLTMTPVTVPGPCPRRQNPSSSSMGNRFGQTDIVAGQNSTNGRPYTTRRGSTTRQNKSSFLNRNLSTSTYEFLSHLQDSLLVSWKTMKHKTTNLPHTTALPLQLKLGRCATEYSVFIRSGPVTQLLAELCWSVPTLTALIDDQAFISQTTPPLDRTNEQAKHGTSVPLSAPGVLQSAQKRNEDHMKRIEQIKTKTAKDRRIALKVSRAHEQEERKAWNKRRPGKKNVEVPSVHVIGSLYIQWHSCWWRRQASLIHHRTYHNIVPGKASEVEPNLVKLDADPRSGRPSGRIFPMYHHDLSRMGSGTLYWRWEGVDQCPSSYPTPPPDIRLTGTESQMSSKCTSTTKTTLYRLLTQDTIRVMQMRTGPPVQGRRLRRFRRPASDGADRVPWFGRVITTDPAKHRLTLRWHEPNEDGVYVREVREGGTRRRAAGRRVCQGVMRRAGDVLPETT